LTVELVRSEPNLSGRVIGQLDANSMVNIIECAFNEETIENVSAYWYKIEYNNSYGYIWGGFIAVETLAYDIDNNGINEYFHYRISRIENTINSIDLNRDLFIYINDSLKAIDSIDPLNNLHNKKSIWTFCEIRESGYESYLGGPVEILFAIYDKGGSQKEVFWFYISENGEVNGGGGVY
jgi:hypothetical protein